MCSQFVQWFCAFSKFILFCWCFLNVNLKFYAVVLCSYCVCFRLLLNVYNVFKMFLCVYNVSCCCHEFIMCLCCFLNLLWWTWPSQKKCFGLMCCFSFYIMCLCCYLHICCSAIVSQCLYVLKTVFCHGYNVFCVILNVCFVVVYGFVNCYIVSELFSQCV